LDAKALTGPYLHIRCTRFLRVQWTWQKWQDTGWEKRFFLKLFFKPLVEPLSRSNQQLFSENTSYYLLPPQDRTAGRLSLLHTDAYWVVMATYHIHYVFMSFKAVPFESRMFPNIFLQI
jgi:hypothetical protein